jgi:hypothetical protein
VVWDLILLLDVLGRLGYFYGGLYVCRAVDRLISIQTAGTNWAFEDPDEE